MGNGTREGKYWEREENMKCRVCAEEERKRGSMYEHVLVWEECTNCVCEK